MISIVKINRVLSVLLLALLPFFALSQTPADVVKECLSEIAKKYQAVGLSFAIVKGGEIVHADALGYSDLEAKKPLDTDGLFRIASISKSFTATVIMQLQEEGKLSIKDDIQDYFDFPIRNPKFKDTPITLEMMLSHTSSLSDANGYFNFDVLQSDKNLEWEKAYASYAPGTKYAYCNLNFNLLGAVIEKVCKERFDKVIESRVLAPLGLKAGYNVSDLDASKFVKLYTYNSKIGAMQDNVDAYATREQEIANYILGESTHMFSPTGGMKISTMDLAKYMMMHMNMGSYAGRQIISASSEKEMRTPRNAQSKYGLALLENTDIIPGVTLVGHTGDAYGLYSNMYFDPAIGLGIVAITNGCVSGFDGDDLEFSKEVVSYLYAAFKE